MGQRAVQIDLENATNSQIMLGEAGAERRRTLSVGGTDLELTYPGRNHTEDMLLMRLPREQLIFTVDWIPVEGVFFQSMPGFYLPDL